MHYDTFYLTLGGIMDNMKVFISYSWDSEEHKKWVKEFACKLSSNGVCVHMDQFDAIPGTNLVKFMENGINDSSWIICVISTNYITRMDDLSTGVGKEVKQIIEQWKSDKVIPILRNNQNHIVPNALNEKVYIDFDNGNETDNMEELLDVIYGIKTETRPILGKSPYRKDVAQKLIIRAEIEKTGYQNPALADYVSFDYSNNDGDYIIGVGEYSFATKWSKASDKCIYAYKDSLRDGYIGLVKNPGLINDAYTLKDIDFTSRTRTAFVGDTVVWINSYRNIALTKVISIKDQSRNDSQDLLEFEYKVLKRQEIEQNTGDLQAPPK